MMAGEPSLFLSGSGVPCGEVCRRLTLFALGIALVAAAPNRAAASALDAPSAPAVKEPIDTPPDAPVPPYCGIYCVFMALRALGTETAIQNILKPQYIGSKKGSSLEELIRAAREFGLHAEPMRRMTCAMLRVAECPIILHVKPGMGTNKYLHWVLFMGIEEGKARIYDATGVLARLPEGLRLMDFRELAALWDGTGLVLSRDPIDLKPFYAAVLPWYIGLSGLTLLAVVGLGSVERRWLAPRPEKFRGRALGRAFGEAAALACMVLAGVAAGRALNSGAFLTHRESIAAIQDSHLAAFLPRVRAREMAELANGAREGVILDARLPDDFKAGHIPGAVNVPYGSDADECARALSGVPRDARIVIYCQSNGCSYSERLARTLRVAGLLRIALYREGWIEWERVQRRSDAQQVSSPGGVEKTRRET